MYLTNYGCVKVFRVFDLIFKYFGLLSISLREENYNLIIYRFKNNSTSLFDVHSQSLLDTFFVVVAPDGRLAEGLRFQPCVKGQL